MMYSTAQHSTLDIDIGEAIDAVVDVRSISRPPSLGSGDQSTYMAVVGCLWQAFLVGVKFPASVIQNCSGWA